METPGVTPHGLVKIERISSWTQSAISIPRNFTATRPSRRPCAYPPDTIRMSKAGRVVSNDLAGQARQALINLLVCLRRRTPILIMSFVVDLDQGRSSTIRRLCRLCGDLGAAAQPARPHSRHGQRLRRYRCPVRNRSARGCAQQVKCALSLKREGCPSTSSRHRLIKIPCGGCDR